MAKFVYQMQSVLNINEKLEKQAQISFHYAKTKVQQEKETLKKLENKKMYYEEELKKTLSDNLELSEIRNGKNYMLCMDGLVKQQEEQVIRFQNNMEKERQRLTAYNMERKKHERLKEKAFEVYKTEEIRTEMKEIDEIINFKNDRN